MADHHAYLALMLQLAHDVGSNFDIVHNHSLHYLPVAMAPTLSIPMLTTVHTPPTPWLESALKARAEITTGTRFAAVSEHTAAAWRPLIPDITLVPNGVDIRRWPLGKGGGPLTWFGRMTAEKAPHLAIAAAQHARRPLILAGPVSDPCYFADHVAPHLSDKVRYAGHLDQGQLARLVGEAEAVLVTPMWDEPYGLVVAEAMCCGTPVIAFARGGIPELMTPQAGRLVAAGDVPAMAAAIPEAVRLPRSQVRRYAVARCAEKTMLRTYLDLYRQMTSTHSEATYVGLLRPPQRFWACGTGDEHRSSITCSGDSTELFGDSYPESVRRRCKATA